MLTLPSPRPSQANVLHDAVCRTAPYDAEEAGAGC
jgi:hypothetical protein